VLYRNNTRQQRQASLNRTVKETDGIGAGIRDFNDNSKLQLLNSIPNDRTFSRNRKLAELSSNPIFDLGTKDYDKQINYDTYLPTQSFQ
jgi:hypothetical protein